MSLNPRDKPDASPCIGVCSHATGDLVCRGCGRTVEEVREWNSYTSEQKVRIKERIKMSTLDTRPHSDRRDIHSDKPHYWKEREGMYKVRFGAWVFVGQTLINCHENYLYWSRQSNVKPHS